MHDAHGVQVVDSIQHLADEPTGVHLGVESLLHNAVEQLAAGNPARHVEGERGGSRVLLAASHTDTDNDFKTAFLAKEHIVLVYSALGCLWL